MRILDQHGNQQTLTWLYDEFGPIEIVDPESPVSPEGTYSVVQLQESVGPASISVWVLDKDGNPAPNVKLVFWWPDAPVLPDSGHLGKGVTGRTDQTGRVGFDIGRGAYYDPRQTRGPHDLWVFGRGVSERISGLGMIAGTNHRLLNVTLQLGTGGGNGGGDPDDDLDPDTAELLQHAIADLRCVVDVLYQALHNVTTSAGPLS